MQGFKSAILPKMKNCQCGTFEPLHEILNFFGKSILLKHYETVINKKFSENVPGSAKSMNKVSQSKKKKNFLKKPSQDLKNYFVLGSYESLKSLEG
jgi:hypothetical protein